MFRAVVAVCLMSAATGTIASDRLGALLGKDPSAEAEKAFSLGDRRHIVLPVCTKEGGEVIPGWPLEDSPEVQRGMTLAVRPISCADFGDDPKQAKFIRATKYAERYNRKLLELERKASE